MSLEKNTNQEIIKRVIALALILIGIIFFVFSNPKPYIYGLIFGTTINILNFRLMSLTLEKAVTKRANRIKGYVMGNYIIRYIIYGVVLYISVIADYISFVTVVIGFLMVKIIIISDAFCDIIKIKFKRHSKKI